MSVKKQKKQWRSPITVYWQIGGNAHLFQLQSFLPFVHKNYPLLNLHCNVQGVFTPPVKISMVRLQMQEFSQILKNECPDNPEISLQIQLVSSPILCTALDCTLPRDDQHRNTKSRTKMIQWATNYCTYTLQFIKQWTGSSPPQS